ncbi:antitoxin [Escherichia coli]|nr:antitoxin [Escherichia coli]
MQQEAELKALVNKSDDDIDYSDIPASGSDAWADAKRGNFLPNLGIHAQ